MIPVCVPFWCRLWKLRCRFKDKSVLVMRIAWVGVMWISTIPTIGGPAEQGVGLGKSWLFFPRWVPCVGCFCLCLIGWSSMLMVCHVEVGVGSMVILWQRMSVDYVLAVVVAVFQPINGWELVFSLWISIRLSGLVLHGVHVHCVWFTIELASVEWMVISVSFSGIVVSTAGDLLDFDCRLLVEVGVEW